MGNALIFASLVVLFCRCAYVGASMIGRGNRTRRIGVTGLTAWSLWMLIVYGLRLAGEAKGITPEIVKGSYAIGIVLASQCVWELSHNLRRDYLNHERGIGNLTTDALKARKRD